MKKQFKENITILYVAGMHCSSCEVLINKKLRKELKNKKVFANLSQSRVDIQGINPKEIDIEKINNVFKDSGYRFSLNKVEVEDRKLFTFNNGSLLINKEKFNQLFYVISIILILFIIFNISQSTGIGQKFSLDSNSSILSFFIFGVIAGLSSCAALVGGLLLSLTKKWNELNIEKKSKLERSKPFILFNIGRILSFTILGGILGVIGSSLGITIGDNPMLVAIVIIIVSIIMAILGLQMLDVKWAYWFKIRIPTSISNSILNSDGLSEEKVNNSYVPFFIGASTFFLPCSFTLIAQGLALSSGSFITGALMLLLFSLGTFPTLGLISFTSINLSNRPRLNAIFSMVSGILVLFLAIYNINSQLNVLGLPSLNDIKFDRANKNYNGIEYDKEGNQIIRIIAQGSSYIPASNMRIKAGENTRLIVDNRGIEGCGITLSARGLIDGYVPLRYGLNTYDLGKIAKGTYKITCSMGMVTPVTVIVE